MNPDFLQSQIPAHHIAAWKPIIGILIVFLGTCVGVEIKVSKEDEEN